MDLEKELHPEEKKYYIYKEVKAVSIPDAIRKERGATIFKVAEVYEGEDERWHAIIMVLLHKSGGDCHFYGPEC